MAEAYKRKLIGNTNKYQHQIVLATFILPLTYCLVIYFLILLMENDLTRVLTSNAATPNAALIYRWMGVLTLCLIALLFALLAWSYVLSKRIVGPFGRIIRELDEVLEGKRKTPIKARPKDILANELLERVNVLIAHYRK